jgi:hypothetical protein
MTLTPGRQQKKMLSQRHKDTKKKRERRSHESFSIMVYQVHRLRNRGNRDPDT